MVTHKEMVSVRVFHECGESVCYYSVLWTADGPLRLGGVGPILDWHSIAEKSSAKQEKRDVNNWRDSVIVVPIREAEF